MEYLYERIEQYREFVGVKDVPHTITSNLSSRISLREYQKHALSNFISFYEDDKLSKNNQIHTLFHMATGSGKTVIMAALVLYLYSKGYRKFLFFVNQTNVLEKTVDNFTNNLSNKYLFNNAIEIDGNRIKINRVDNFSRNISDEVIEIIFTTTQKLHMDLFNVKENSISYEDFEEDKIVFISDESHHINSWTKKPNQDEELAKKSWEYTVMNALNKNRNNIMLEFTATCDLKDNNVLSKYRDKIVFNYPLFAFRESGYTKDFQNLATDTDLWTRTLIALIMSEYRKFLFAEMKLNIKPVILLKSQYIKESKEFYNDFFKNIKNLTTHEIKQLELVGIKALSEAIQYFLQKDETLELLEQSIKSSFNQETSIIMHDGGDNKEKQLLVNSLEDINNPIRTIFAVDMLNEGWDVLNLFDIVRLYDTRQGSGKAGKIGEYTIKEAQLIGRGARYCPFVDGDEALRFKRKYDNDLQNKNRILETMFFHSKNDSRYISELKQALIETGLQAKNPITIEYNLKTEFKNSDFYKQGYIFSNKRVPKRRDHISNIETSMRNRTYYYMAHTGRGKLINLFENESLKNEINETKIKTIKLKDIDLNILLGASEYFSALRFDNLKEKYPTLNSSVEFFTSDKFVGNSRLEITYSADELRGRDLFNAVKKAMVEISSYVNSLKQEFVGSTDFIARPLKDVIKNKKIYLEKVDFNDGRGVSQNNCSNEKYRMDLDREDWYVFNDNYGTNEEKLFIKYFKTSIEPKLKEKELEYYVIRNERIPELAIYSFEDGERFEPDFLLFVRKKESATYQSYIEPKGTHLLEHDAWKETFSLELNNKAKINGIFSGKYKIIGLPFFNSEYRIENFESAVIDWIDAL